MPKNRHRNSSVNNWAPIGIVTKNAIEQFENNIVNQENYLEKSGVLEKNNNNIVKGFK